jgi:hypothetical protein
MNLQLKKLEARFDLERYIEQFEFVMVGDNAVMHCPVCEKDAKLYVLMHDKRDTDGSTVPRGTWICYYCRDNDAGGSGRTCLSLIEWMEDVEFLDAIRRLSEGGTTADANFIVTVEKMWKSLSDEGADDGAESSTPSVVLPREFIPIDERHYPAYANERGISRDRAMRFHLGYCTRGYYANRLIAPVYFDQRCVGFQARWMAKKPPIDPETGKRISKTKHAKGAKMSRVLYNWDEAREAKRLVLIESPWAAIKIGRTGAATFGKHLSAAQLELVMKSDAEEIVIAWDLDKDHKPGKGGYDKALAFGERLSSLVPVRVVKLKRDIDEMTLAELRELIARTRVMSANDAWAARIERRMSWLG